MGIYILSISPFEGLFSRKTHGCWGNPPFSETTTTWTSVIIFCIQKLSAEILLELFATSDPKPGRVRGGGGQWLCLVATFPLRIPMGRVRYIYLHEWLIFYGKCRWRYQSHGSVMGLNLLNLDLFVRWLVSTIMVKWWFGPGGLGLEWGCP